MPHKHLIPSAAACQPVPFLPLYHLESMVSPLWTSKLSLRSANPRPRCSETPHPWVLQPPIYNTGGVSPADSFTAGHLIRHLGYRVQRRSLREPMGAHPWSLPGSMMQPRWKGTTAQGGGAGGLDSRFLTSACSSAPVSLPSPIRCLRQTSPVLCASPPVSGPSLSHLSTPHPTPFLLPALPPSFH